MVAVAVAGDRWWDADQAFPVRRDHVRVRVRVRVSGNLGLALGVRAGP